jgi:hypothetical protein
LFDRQVARLLSKSDQATSRPGWEHAWTLFRRIGFAGAAQDNRRVVDAHDDALDQSKAISPQEQEPACHGAGERQGRQVRIVGKIQSL